MIALHRGDRVRYTERFGRAMTLPNRRTDWSAREGRVASEPRPGGDSVGVVWDGTETQVREVRGTLEKIA